MERRKKNLILLLAGLAAYFIFGTIKAAFETEGILRAVLFILQYGGFLAFIFGGHYFTTTYQYEKYPEESKKAVVDSNDGRFLDIKIRTKAKVFDIISYVLILLPALFFELKAGMIAVACSLAVLIIMGLLYAFFYRRYSRDM